MKDENCIFCKLASGDIPTSTLYEDDSFRVILDLGPASKGHCLILPKDHYANLLELPDELGMKVMPLAKKIGAAVKEAVGADGFNVVQNNGTAAGQTVMHYHVHIIPRFEGEKGIVEWTPGQLSQGEAEDIVKAVKKCL